MERKYNQFLSYPSTYLAAVRDELNELAKKQTINDIKRDYEKRGMKKVFKKA